MKNAIKAEISTNIHATVSSVWDALTNPDTIRKYFFGTNAETTWKVGSPVRFTGNWQGKTYEDKGTVLQVIKNELVQYTYWSSMSGIEDKPENYVVITYKISGKDNDVNLTIRQENIPDEKTKKHSLENWQKVLDGLKKVVEERELNHA